MKTNIPLIETLEMRKIYKEFPGVIANNNIDFTIRKGEIVSLLGENGAGKTTLMNILYGLYRMDRGEIFINGKKVNIKSPRDAINHGIGMVHQHFMLIDNHTVLENLSLYLDDVPIINPEKVAEKKLNEFIEKFKFKINPKSKVYELSLGEQQKLEIIKILLRGASLIILDEPTSVLTPKEADELFELLFKLKEDGKSVIFITHKLNEVYKTCDRVVVLRNGRKVYDGVIKNVTKEDLAKLMVEREVSFVITKKDVKPKEVVLSVKDLYVRNDKGMLTVKGVSFDLRRYEILGIAGVSGNGQKELIESLTGLRKIEKGEVYFFGKKIGNLNSKIFRNFDIAHIPEERTKFGIVPNLQIIENSVLRVYDKRPFLNKFSLNFKIIKDFSEKIVKNYNVSTPSVSIKVKNLSGGNIQKFILGREIETKKDLIIAAHPTYGLDISATRYIRECLVKMRDEGSAILIVSEDLDEILEISDRIAVMYEGKFMKIGDIKDFSIDEIGLLMGGVSIS
ncbi:MAG: ABC transporter ATP-binding protein [Caldisericia bacterium]|jgi:simple sugar transport system ATP-binding protein|nr:ABC transporter ATP-binding protein [Caldisericia bacterium]